MIIGRIAGTTRIMGEEQDEYFNLPIRDEQINYEGQIVNRMVSVWELTPGELEKLNNGGKIYLKILGTMHPPVSLEIE